MPYLRSFALGFSVLALGTFSLRAESRDDADRARSIRSPSFVELDKRVYDRLDRKITLIRVRPPNLAKAPPAPLPEPLTAAQQARIEERETKAYASLTITATVFFDGDRATTELRWRNETTGNLEFVAYSNADFRYLTQLHHLETATTIYQWFPFVYAYTLEEWTKEHDNPIPKGLTFSPGVVEYLVDARTLSAADHESTFAGLDHLHAYYQLHYADLKADFEKRETASAAREEELRRNPPKPQNVTMQWWVPARSTSSKR